MFIWINKLLGRVEERRVKISPTRSQRHKRKSQSTRVDLVCTDFKRQKEIHRQAGGVQIFVLGAVVLMALFLSILVPIGLTMGIMGFLAASFFKILEGPYKVLLGIYCAVNGTVEQIYGLAEKGNKIVAWAAGKAKDAVQGVANMAGSGLQVIPGIGDELSTLVSVGGKVFSSPFAIAEKAGDLASGGLRLARSLSEFMCKMNDFARDLERRGYKDSFGKAINCSNWDESRYGALDAPDNQEDGKPKYCIEGADEADKNNFLLPPWLVDIYMTAGKKHNVPWEVLAAINLNDTNIGQGEWTKASDKTGGRVGWIPFSSKEWLDKDKPRSRFNAASDGGATPPRFFGDPYSSKAGYIIRRTPKEDPKYDPDNPWKRVKVPARTCPIPLGEDGGALSSGVASDDYKIGQYPGDDAPKSAIAKWMGEAAKSAKFPPELPIMAALVESNMTNIQGGDADSVGFFQMRTGIWNKGPYQGYPKKPELQLKWFLDTAITERKTSKGKNNLKNSSSWGEFIADVERPAAQYRGRYQTKLTEARKLLGGAGGFATTSNVNVIHDPDGSFDNCDPVDSIHGLAKWLSARGARGAVWQDVEVDTGEGEDSGGGGEQITTSGGAKGIVDNAFKVALEAGGDKIYVASAYRAGDPLDHGSNNSTKAARDIAYRGVDALFGPPRDEIDKGMAQLGKQFGRDYGNGKKSTVDTFQWQGYRIQIIWRTPAYGGHMGHIHIGAKKQNGPSAPPDEEAAFSGSGAGMSECFSKKQEKFPSVAKMIKVNTGSEPLRLDTCLTPVNPPSAEECDEKTGAIDTNKISQRISGQIAAAAATFETDAELLEAIVRVNSLGGCLMPNKSYGRGWTGMSDKLFKQYGTNTDAEGSGVLRTSSVEALFSTARFLGANGVEDGANAALDKFFADDPRKRSKIGLVKRAIKENEVEEQPLTDGSMGRAIQMRDYRIDRELKIGDAQPCKESEKYVDCIGAIYAAVVAEYSKREPKEDSGALGGGCGKKNGDQFSIGDLPDIESEGLVSKKLVRSKELDKVHVINTPTWGREDAVKATTAVLKAFQKCYPDYKEKWKEIKVGDWGAGAISSSKGVTGHKSHKNGGDNDVVVQGVTCYNMCENYKSEKAIVLAALFLRAGAKEIYFNDPEVEEFLTKNRKKEAEDNPKYKSDYAAWSDKPVFPVPGHDDHFHVRWYSNAANSNPAKLKVYLNGASSGEKSEETEDTSMGPWQ